jgi:hypothetical protein
MRRSIAIFAIAIVAVLNITVLPVSSEQIAKTNISEYCESHSDLGLSHGACVAYLENHNLVPHDATVCHSAGIQNLLGVTSHGQCVRRLGEMHR